MSTRLGVVRGLNEYCGAFFSRKGLLSTLYAPGPGLTSLSKMQTEHSLTYYPAVTSIPELSFLDSLKTNCAGLVSFCFSIDVSTEKDWSTK